MGQAPMVSLTTNVDIDSTQPGIQVMAGTTVPLLANVTDDVQVRNVELLINGEVVGNDISFPFDFNIFATERLWKVNTATLQVLVHDTGGNTTRSNLLTLELLEDTIPPSVISSSLAEGSQPASISEISLRFDENIDPSSLALSGMTLTNLGVDRILGLGMIWQ